MGSILTIDTGGTKTRIIQFSSSANPYSPTESITEISAEFKTPHNESSYLEELLATITTSFPNFINPSDEDVVVLASRGHVGNGIVTSTLLNWHEFDLEKAIRVNLGVSNVISGNDAKIGAIGAFAGKNYQRGLYLAIGTGIGGGMMINGKLSEDLADMEIGKILTRNNQIPATWEKTASGSAFFEKYGNNSDEMNQDDPIWQEYATGIAEGILVLLPILRPEEIIIGGGMSKFFPKYKDHLQKIILSDAWPPASNVIISATEDYSYTVNKGALILALKLMEKDED